MLDEHSGPTSNDDAADSSQLVALVDQLLAKTRAGSPVDIERVVADPPKLGQCVISIVAPHAERWLKIR